MKRKKATWDNSKLTDYINNHLNSQERSRFPASYIHCDLQWVPKKY